ncbi:hypothetical protein FOCC_FOCC016555 [Frankliniella occidentalis]|nr:hypothetical protein FOCC_FOCC016555 [Frankliniella occidentalis]
MPHKDDSVEKRGTSSVQVNQFKRRSFDANFKKIVVKYARENTIKAAARKYDVEPKSVRLWLTQEEDLKCCLSSRKAFRGPKKRKVSGNREQSCRVRECHSLTAVQRVEENDGAGVPRSSGRAKDSPDPI